MNSFVYLFPIFFFNLIFFILCSGSCNAQIHAGGKGDGYDYIEIQINPNSIRNNSDIAPEKKSSNAIRITDGRVPAEILKILEDKNLSYSILNTSGSAIWNGNLNSLRMLSFYQYSNGIYLLTSNGGFISYLLFERE